MDKGKLKGHAALWVANLVWGLNAPIGKSVLWSEHNPGGVSPFALSVYRMLGACLLFWSVSLFLPRERVARRDIVLLLFASVFGIQLNQMLFLWGLSLTSPIDSSIIATVVPVLTMVLATLFLREPITWLKAGGVFLGCAGALPLILVSRHGTGHTSSVKGDVLCLVSAVSYATYLTAFRNVIVKYSPVTTMKWMFLFAAVVAAAVYYRPLAAVDYARAPDMGRNRLRGRLLDLPLLLHGADRTALPAAHGGVDVQLRTTRRGGAFLGRNRSRLLRVHQGRGGPVRLRRGLAGDQIQIAGAGGGGSGHEKRLSRSGPTFRFTNTPRTAGPHSTGSAPRPSSAPSPPPAAPSGRRPRRNRWGFRRREWHS